jgi:septum formation protein
MVILASQSPRRRALLARLVEKFDVVPADIDERRNEGELPRDYVLRLALGKASKVQKKYPHATIIGADTTVALDSDCLQQPSDAAEAIEMLERLSGRTHRVFTGVAVLNDRCRLTEQFVTKVRFMCLTRALIEEYVASGEPFGKAGAYALQGLGDILVDSVSGSVSNVIGLPLRGTMQMLMKAGEPLKLASVDES